MMAVDDESRAGVGGRRWHVCLFWLVAAAVIGTPWLGLTRLWMEIPDAMYGILVGGAALVVCHRLGVDLRAMVGIPRGVGGWGFALLVALVYPIFNVSLCTLAPGVADGDAGRPLWWSLTTGMFIAPIVEELMFRGLTMRLLSRRWGITVGVVATSLVFAVWHGDLGRSALIVRMVGGLLFSVVLLRTGSLLPAMVAHGLSNLHLDLMDLASCYPFGVECATIPRLMLFMVVTGAILTAVLVWAWPRSERELPGYEDMVKGGWTEGNRSDELRRWANSLLLFLVATGMLIASLSMERNGFYVYCALLCGALAGGLAIWRGSSPSVVERVIGPMIAKWRQWSGNLVTGSECAEDDPLRGAWTVFRSFPLAPFLPWLAVAYIVSDIRYGAASVGRTQWVALWIHALMAVATVLLVWYGLRRQGVDIRRLMGRAPTTVDRWLAASAGTVCAVVGAIYTLSAWDSEFSRIYAKLVLGPSAPSLLVDGVLWPLIFCVVLPHIMSTRCRTQSAVWVGTLICFAISHLGFSCAIGCCFCFFVYYKSRSVSALLITSIVWRLLQWQLEAAVLRQSPGSLPVLGLICAFLSAAMSWLWFVVPFLNEPTRSWRMLPYFAGLDAAPTHGMAENEPVQSEAELAAAGVSVDDRSSAHTALAQP